MIFQGVWALPDVSLGSRSGHVLAGGGPREVGGTMSLAWE